MLELHYWPTPNGWKITILLEELALPYEVRPVNIGKGEQFAPDFLKISPNNRMPALVDTEPAGGGAPVTLFESGAILLYLAEKTGRFLPADVRGRYEVIKWLMWQMGGLGPMSGQAGHFRNYAPEKIPYAIERYTKEVNRLYGVMDRRLADRPFLAGEYSIADMACYPWAKIWSGLGQSLDEFPHLRRWLDEIKARPAVERGLAVGRDWRTVPATDEEARKHLFGQTARSVQAGQPERPPGAEAPTGPEGATGKDS